MAEWTIEQVAERFREAAQTAHRLPAVRVQGYFNTWPAILRQPWETFAAADGEYRLPPDPTAIDRMEETMGWVLWLAEEDRHLVWMRRRLPLARDLSSLRLRPDNGLATVAAGAAHCGDAIERRIPADQGEWDCVK